MEMLKASQWFKGVKFEHVSGYKRADNMRTYDSRTYEGAYMAGVIAGKMTKWHAGRGGLHPNLK